MYAPAHVRPPRPELRVFLQDVRATPDDAGLRLILADWLEDHGDDADRGRAELIRLQCARANEPRRVGWMERREEELIARWEWDWLGPLPDLCDQWQTDRGMVRLTFRSVAFFTPRLVELSGTEAYQWVDSLTLLNVTGGAMAHLVSHPLLDGVRELIIHDGRIGNNGLQVLSTSPHLHELRVLRLVLAGIGGRPMGAIRWPAFLPKLQTLDLSQNRLNDVDVMPLLARMSPRLKELRLGFNDLGNDTLRGLGLGLYGLEVLDLTGNRRCADAGVAQLPQAAPRLRWLGLAQTHVGEAGLRALAAGLPELEELVLDRCDLADGHVKALAFSEGLPRLHTLSLGRNLLGDEAVIALVNGPARPWRRLALANNHIGPRGVQALAESPDVAGLQELVLDGNRIGDDGALALARSPHLGSLRWLDVSNNGLCVAAQAALIRRFGRRSVIA